MADADTMLVEICVPSVKFTGRTFFFDATETMA
jgi:hypothetical protein